MLRTGLRAAREQDVGPPGTAYTLPTFDPGAMLIPDLRSLKELLDDEDDARVPVAPASELERDPAAARADVLG